MHCVGEQQEFCFPLYMKPLAHTREGTGPMQGSPRGPPELGKGHGGGCKKANFICLSKAVSCYRGYNMGAPSYLGDLAE